MVQLQKIPAGYKQTDVGVIPEDWEVKELDSISTVIDPHPSHRAPTEDLNGIPFVGIGDLSELGEIKTNSFRKVSEQIYNEHRNRYHLEDDLLGLGRVASIGKVVKLRKKTFKYTISPTLGIIKPSKINKDLLFFLLNSSLVTSQFSKIMSGSTRSSVGMIVLRKLKIPCPINYGEQEKIAAALSDIDSLISKLDQLIQKKKNLKQGVMQELLTGKRRLPGFSGEWGLKAMGEIGITYGGLSGKTKSDFENGRFPYIPFMNIMSNPIIDTTYFDYVNIKPSENQNKASKGDLFFNGSSETPEEVGMCSALLEDISNLYLNSFCFGFKLKKELKTNSLYLAYFYRSDVGRKLIFSLAQGATRYNLSKTKFMKLEIPYPDPEEQTTLANAFSDMDSEIFKLQIIRDKYADLKQGMMQQLLTGKIRLI